MFASSCCSDKLLTAPATSTSSTKDSWEGRHDRRAGLPYVSCLTLQSGSANICQSLSGQDESYSIAGMCVIVCNREIEKKNVSNAEDLESACNVAVG